MTSATSLRSRFHPLLPLLLALAMFAVAYVHAPARHSAGETVYFLAFYLALAAALHLGLCVARSLGKLALVLMALAIGFVVSMQLRMDAELLAGPARFALGVLVLGGGYLALWAWSSPAAPGAVLRSALHLALATTVCLVLALYGFFGSQALRWHQLLHHRLIGQPFYYLFCDSIRSERLELWAARPRLVDPWERANEVVEVLPDVRERAPHLVVLLIDTLRADALGAYGGDPSWMPVTNALAERSTVYRNVLANASWTRASVASLFTGLLPEEHGAVRFHDSLSTSWITMAEALQQAGYRTGAFVANWVQVGKETGFDQGFEVFEELLGDVEQAGRAKYARAEVVNRAGLAWLDLLGEGSPVDEPVFLYLHYLDPHAPYLSGGEPGSGSDPRERKRGAYRQELRYLDSELAKLYEALEEKLDGPFRLVLTSDHGEEFWEHGQWGHGHALYQELVWVPAFCYDSAAQGGAVLEQPLELRDLYDLVLRSADHDVDLEAWGRDRSRTVRYASQFLDRTAKVRPDRKHTAMRMVEEADQRLIWSGYGPSYELYDRQGDPRELFNRIDRDPLQAETLRARLEQHVRFWAQPPKVERSANSVEFLHDLGYAGGAREEDTY